MRKANNSGSVLARWLSALAAGAAIAALAPQAYAGIANTKHNLGTTGTGTNHVSAGTTEICVFCHTPHGANTGVHAPLWNKSTPSTTYTNYDSTGAAFQSPTIDGNIAAVGSVSLACLSCHDGTQAMDTMVNAPGSGGYTAGGARPSGYTWNTDVGTTGKMPAGITNLGSDLSNDHPIGIEYCGGFSSGTTCRDRDFVSPSGSSATYWYVDTCDSARSCNGVTTGTNGTRERTDMILYTRSGETTKPRVECASCHDPHVESGTTSGGSGPAAGATFLRIANAGSGVCLACHTK